MGEKFEKNWSWNDLDERGSTEEDYLMWMKREVPGLLNALILAWHKIRDKPMYSCVTSPTTDWETITPSHEQTWRLSLKDSNFRRYQIIRWMVYISLFWGHSSYYFSWKSYTFAIPALIRDLNLKKNELVDVTSGFAAMYQGVEKFSGGYIIGYSES